MRSFVHILDTFISVFWQDKVEGGVQVSQVDLVSVFIQGGAESAALTRGCWEFYSS